LFLALSEEKLNKLLDQLKINWIPVSGRISGLTGYLAGYPAGQSSIRSDTGTGYKKGRIFRLDIRPEGYPVHP
jgi:hypothetical protein